MGQLWTPSKCYIYCCRKRKNGRLFPKSYFYVSKTDYCIFKQIKLILLRLTSKFNHSNFKKHCKLTKKIKTSSSYKKMKVCFGSFQFLCGLNIFFMPDYLAMCYNDIFIINCLVIKTLAVSCPIPLPLNLFINAFFLVLWYEEYFKSILIHIKCFMVGPT